MKYIFFIFFIFSSILNAQLHDNNWVLGGACAEPSDTFAIAILDFSEQEKKPKINKEINLFISTSNCSMSNSSGALQFYTNGNNIINYNQRPLKNGSHLADDDECRPQGLQQGAFSMPHPNLSNQYILITINGQRVLEEPIVDYLFLQSVYYNVVDMDANEGEGELVVRQELVLRDTLNPSQGMVCQHANGRDWWLLLFEGHSNQYYRFLFDQNGVSELGSASVEQPVRGALSQVAYSSDGSKYAAFNTFNLEQLTFISLFDFDRCNGILSNQKKLSIPYDLPAGGLAFSSNSRFLYVASNFTIYQYDLWAEDVESSRFTVGEWDGYLEIGLSATSFSLMQIAADNKIYITSPSDGHFLHVIHEPNKKGLECDFELRGLEWPTWRHIAIPNAPHYRMGALEGSLCDTLGLFLVPPSHFVYTVNQASIFDFNFENRTTGEVDEWFWDFGDGNTSNVEHPSHGYALYGSYRVCLTATNQVGSNTFCRDICIYPEQNSFTTIDAPNLLLDCSDVNTSVNLSASLVALGMPNTNQWQAEWYGPDDFYIEDQQEIQASSAGTYYLTLTDTIHGCSFTDSVLLSYNEAPLTFDLRSSNDLLPCEQSVEVQVMIENGCYEVILFTPLGELIIGDELRIFSLTDTGEYVFIVRYCDDTCETFQEYFLEADTITAQWEESGEYQNVQFTSIETDDVEHQWIFGDGNTSDESNPDHLYAEDGIYTVTHIVSNACDSDTLIATLEIIMTSTSSIEQAGLKISPNPTSNILNIYSAESEIVRMNIYSTQGQKIYSQHGLGLEGTIDVSNLVSGIYWIDILLKNGHQATGKVLVIN